ncbi:hypothetical protein PCANB_000603 [Pneumocystis canis]|nr:hypothetical protein PCANB_000603 [Pneumocystis canis]
MGELKKETILKLYEAFFQRPTKEIFSDECILTYVTTCISFYGSKNVLLQLAEYCDQIRSRNETINLHMTENGVISEVFSEIEFINGPAWFVPGLDNNFYVDRKIHLPLIYIIEVNDDEKITFIRVFWDQATVLKQLEIIGSNRQAWPIKLGKEQYYFIKNRENNSSTLSCPKEKQQKLSEKISIFEPYEELSREFYPIPVQPRSSAKPALRPYEDLFITKGTPISVKPSKAGQRSHTMSKVDAIICNEFDSQQENEIPIKKSSKYTHFEFSTPTEKELEEERKAMLAKAKKGTSLRSMLSNWDEYEQTSIYKSMQSISNQTSEDLQSDIKKNIPSNNRFYRPDQVHFSFSDESPPEKTSRIVQNDKYDRVQYSAFDYLSSEETQKQNANIKKTDTIARLERDMNAKWSFSDN